MVILSHCAASSRAREGTDYGSSTLGKADDWSLEWSSEEGEEEGEEEEEEESRPVKINKEVKVRCRVGGVASGLEELNGMFIKGRAFT